MLPLFALLRSLVVNSIIYICILLSFYTHIVHCPSASSLLDTSPTNQIAVSQVAD